MKTHLLAAIAAIIALFAPIGPTLAAMVAMVVADLISGVVASRVKGMSITSAGLKVTVVKLLVYLAAIVLSFIVDKYLAGDIVSVTKVVTSMIGLTELKSVLENIECISGVSVIETIIAKLGDNDGK